MVTPFRSENPQAHLAVVGCVWNGVQRNQGGLREEWKIKFSEKVKALIDAYIELGQRTCFDDSQIIDALTDIFDKEELDELNILLEIEREEKNELAEKLKNVQQSYTHLKTAKTISLYDKDIAETKSRLSYLVREVDKCINLLNG